MAGRGKGGWRKYSVPELVFMMQGENPAAIHEQVKGWVAARDKLRDYRRSLQASRDAVAERFPPERSEAAAEFARGIEFMLQRLDKAVDDATSNIFALNDTANAIEQAHRQILEIGRAWSQHAGEWQQAGIIDGGGRVKDAAWGTSEWKDARLAGSTAPGLTQQAWEIMESAERWIGEVTPAFKEVTSPQEFRTPGEATDPAGPQEDPGSYRGTGWSPPSQVPSLQEARAAAWADADPAGDGSLPPGWVPPDGWGSTDPTLAGSAPPVVGPGPSPGNPGTGGWGPAGGGPAATPIGGGNPGGGFVPTPGLPGTGRTSWGTGSGGGRPGGMGQPFGAPGAGGGTRAGSGPGRRAAQPGRVIGGRRGTGSPGGTLGGARRRGRDGDDQRHRFDPDDPWQVTEGVQPVLGHVPQPDPTWTHGDGDTGRDEAETAGPTRNEGWSWSWDPDRDPVAPPSTAPDGGPGSGRSRETGRDDGW